MLVSGFSDPFLDVAVTLKLMMICGVVCQKCFLTKKSDVSAVNGCSFSKKRYKWYGPGCK